MRKFPLSRQRKREQGREGVGEAAAADGGVAEGGSETANQKQKAMSIAVTNKLTGHLCLLPLPVSPACTFPCISVCFPFPVIPSLLPFPCSASRTGTCSLSIYASVWTEVAGAFWNYQAKYSLRCLRISISRCPRAPLPPSCMRNYVFVQPFCREPLNMPPATATVPFAPLLLFPLLLPA